MREGFILLTRGYGFMGGGATPFWHVDNLHFNLWYVANLHIVRLAILVLALKNFWDNVIYIMPRGDVNVIGK